MSIEELINQLNLGAVAPCPRCGELCRLAPSDNEKARLLKRSDTVENGLCLNCATQSFLMSVETVAYGIKKKGPEVLLNPMMQEAFSEIIQAGNADARPEEINWKKVVANWELPMPGTKKGKKGRSNQPPGQMALL